MQGKKAVEKFQHPYLKKTLTKVSRVRTYLNMIKAIYDKRIANIILDSE